MGMPTINIPQIDRDLALNSIMASVALQEAALAHILNANGEKVQLAISQADPTGTLYPDLYPGPSGPSEALQDLLEANETVGELVSNVASLEAVLRGKLSDVMMFINPSLDPTLSTEPPVSPTLPSMPIGCDYLT